MLLNLKYTEWIGRALKTSPHQLAISPMKGSNSSAVFLIKNHAQQKFVLRVLDDSKWLQEEPDLAQHEAAALEEAQNIGLSVPKLIAYSESANVTEHPLVLSTFLEGNIDINPINSCTWLEKLAIELAKLHQHRTPDFCWRYESWTKKDMLHTPDWSTNSTIWERAFELISNPQPNYDAVFIHRDYHPTNVLWSNNSISGIVDWINACQGPAGVDVAHCRNNLALMFNVEVADQFLELYIKASDGFEYDAYWDVDSVLDMCLPVPEFYKPWREFGMDIIPQDVLQHRTEGYLESLIKRI